MAINGSVQYNGWFLPDIILLTLCYDHRGTRPNAMMFESYDSRDQSGGISINTLG